MKKTIAVKTGALQNPTSTGRREAVRRMVAMTTMILMVLMSGCGTSVPNERQGEQALRQIIKTINGNDLVRLVKFHKTNGYWGQYQTLHDYVIVYEGEIEYTENCYVPSASERAFLARPEIGVIGKVPVTKGQRQTISGKIYLTKTENGWQGKD